MISQLMMMDNVGLNILRMLDVFVKQKSKLRLRGTTSAGPSNIFTVKARVAI